MSFVIWSDRISVSRAFLWESWVWPTDANTSPVWMSWIFEVLPTISTFPNFRMCVFDLSKSNMLFDCIFCECGVFSKNDNTVGVWLDKRQSRRRLRIVAILLLWLYSRRGSPDGCWWCRLEGVVNESRRSISSFLQTFPKHHVNLRNPHNRPENTRSWDRQVVPSTQTQKRRK